MTMIGLPAEHSVGGVRVNVVADPVALTGTQDREQPKFWLGFGATDGIRGGQ